MGCEKAGPGKRGPQRVLGTPATGCLGKGWEPDPALGEPGHLNRLALLTFGLPQAILGTLFLGTPRHTPQSPFH